MGRSPFTHLGLPRVINASGKMTALGGSAQSAAVAGALARAAGHHVDMAALRSIAGAEIARRTGAEAATVTTGAAAGVAIGVAAMITGTDPGLVERLPDSDGLANEVIIQAGHDVSFGAKVSQMIRLGGGRPVVVGTRDGVSAGAISAAVNVRTAGFLFVQSHHTRQACGLSLAELASLARECDRPLLVDAAAESDLTGYLQQGADLVTYSGGKAIGGPTSGFICGRRDLIEACELQNQGIARAMKVGKEQILGLLKALEDYPAPPAWPERLERLAAALDSLPHATISREADLAGRDIERLAIRSAPGRLARLARSLQTGDPIIYTRNHQLEEGLMLLDLREVRDEDVILLADRIRSLWGQEDG